MKSYGGHVAAERKVIKVDIDRAAQIAWRIRKSSILFPEFSCAVNQRGCLPRPAQVSNGRAGFWNFGKTFG